MPQSAARLPSARCPNGSRRPGGASPRTSACCTRSSTTCSTRTASPRSSGPTTRAGWPARSRVEPVAVWTRSRPTPPSWTSSFRASKGGPRQASLARVRKRLDVLLVERGLAESRAQAQALVMAGLVPGHAKAGEQVEESTELVVERLPRYVSRGGEKLAHALDVLGVEVAGRDCLDVGASTGGFTDVLLQRGAARVIALDVGRGQLHSRLRDDARVTVLERTNARELSALPFAPDLVTCDVSFISVRTALPPALALARPGWEALVLVKPQFEAGRGEAKRGVVRDREVWRRVLRETAAAALGWQAQVAGVVDSGLPGPKGNREFFLHLVHRDEPELPDELERWIDDAIG